MVTDDRDQMYKQCMSCGMIRHPESGEWADPCFYARMPKDITHGICPDPKCELTNYVHMFDRDERIDLALQRLAEHQKKQGED